MLRAVVANIYDKGQANKLMLIHPYDLDLNNDEILSEVKAINPSLGEAIVHDIAKSYWEQSEKVGFLQAIARVREDFEV